MILFDTEKVFDRTPTTIHDKRFNLGVEELPQFDKEYLHGD